MYTVGGKSERVSRSVMSKSLQLYVQQPARLLCPWNSPGKDAGVGSHSLLQEILLTQGSKPGLPHCRYVLYHLSHQGSPCIYSTCHLLNNKCQQSLVTLPVHYYSLWTFPPQHMADPSISVFTPPWCQYMLSPPLTCTTARLPTSISVSQIHTSNCSQSNISDTQI